MKPTESHTLVQVDDLYEDEGAPFRFVDLLVWLGDGKRVIAAVTGLAIAGSVAMALLIPNSYTARTTLLAPQSQQQGGASAAALAALGTLGSIAGGIAAKTPDELYVSLLRSDTVQRALATRFDLYKRFEIDSYENMRRMMQSFIRVTADKKTGVITVEVEDKDPKFAATLANAHAEEISKLLARLAVSEAQQRRVFFEQQLKETKENLINAEQALRQVQEKSGMVVLDRQAEAIFKNVAELKARIVEREVRLRVLRTSATAENPDVQLLVSELAGLRAELSRMESSNGTSQPGSVDIPINKLPAAAVDYVRASREVKFQETMLASMLRQFEIAKLDEAKEGPSLQQVDVALPPDRKSKPKRALIVLGCTIAALLLSSFYVVARGYRAMLNEADPSRSQVWSRVAQAWRLRRRP